MPSASVAAASNSAMRSGRPAAVGRSPVAGKEAGRLSAAASEACGT